MIGTIARLTRWEWFKLQHRWMPWILLLLLLLFSQLGVWGSYVNYRQLASGGEVSLGPVGRVGPAARGQQRALSCADVLAGTAPVPAGLDPAIVTGLQAQCAQIEAQRTQQLQQMYANFTLPGSVKQSLTTASSIGVILMAVLAASLIGVEYGWGTMRTTLVRGVGRGEYLAGKLSILFLSSLAAMLIAPVLTVVSSTIAQGLVAPPDGFVTPGWTVALEAIGRGWYGMVPTIALVTFATVATSSTAMGMAIGIGYSIAEPLVLALLRQLSDRLDHLGDYLLAANTAAWNGTQGLRAAGTAELSMWHHFIVLTATWLLIRRDVTKATGT
jgi:hypothetical protein